MFGWNCTKMTFSTLEWIYWMSMIYSSNQCLDMFGMSWFHWSNVSQWDVRFEWNQTSRRHIQLKAFLTHFQERGLFYCFRVVILHSCSVDGGEPNSQEYIWVHIEENIAANREKKSHQGMYGFPGNLKGIWYSIWNLVLWVKTIENIMCLSRLPLELSIYFLIFQIVSTL